MFEWHTDRSPPYKVYTSPCNIHCVVAVELHVIQVCNFVSSAKTSCQWHTNSVEHAKNLFTSLQQHQHNFLYAASLMPAYPCVNKK